MCSHLERNVYKLWLAAAAGGGGDMEELDVLINSFPGLSLGPRSELTQNKLVNIATEWGLCCCRFNVIRLYNAIGYTWVVRVCVVWDTAGVPENSMIFCIFLWCNWCWRLPNLFYLQGGGGQRLSGCQVWNSAILENHSCQVLYSRPVSYIQHSAPRQLLKILFYRFYVQSSVMLLQQFVVMFDSVLRSRNYVEDPEPQPKLSV